jgi:hypothetical protein
MRKVKTTMAPAVTDFTRLLEGVPPGAWVALSHDEGRVVAFAAEMKEAVTKAHEAGEPNPVILRVPHVATALAL